MSYNVFIPFLVCLCLQEVAQAQFFAAFDVPTQKDVVLDNHLYQGSTTYKLWYPKLAFAKPSSPFTYISDKQRMELLHRMAPLSAVVQKKGHMILRAYVINSGLYENGVLLGYLMGLYKYKCSPHHIYADIYSLEEDAIILFKTMQVIQNLCFIVRSFVDAIIISLVVFVLFYVCYSNWHSSIVCPMCLSPTTL